MATNTINKDAPPKDPYKVLGVSFGATDTEIAKAYRNLARTLHPDKLVSQNLSPNEIDQAAIRFQEIQIARSFLLDTENSERRRKYDTKVASEQVRRATDKAREVGMSERRKRMREELQQNEAQEKVAAVSAVRTNQSSSQRSHSHQQQRPSPNPRVDTKRQQQLAREGMELRERYTVQEALMKQKERAQAALALQNRQIRLKWSRKKLKAEHIPSPSEDSIAQMLSQSCHGMVEQVQMLGDKGNAALVTFAQETHCDVAVQLYRTSELWRAVYVNKTKQDEMERSGGVGPNMDHQPRDQENVQEWKERQAREREALLRRMAHEEDSPDAAAASSSIPLPSKPTSLLKFPISFPEEYLNNSTFKQPLDALEHLEGQLLSGIVSDVMLQQMKVTTGR